MSSTKKSGAISKGSQKRRERRKRLQNSCTVNDTQDLNIVAESKPKKEVLHLHKDFLTDQANNGPCNCPDCSIVKVDIGTMTNDPIESREKVKAAREAKKLAKQEAKMKRDAGLDFKTPAKVQAGVKTKDNSQDLAQEVNTGNASKEVKVQYKVASTVKEQPQRTMSNDLRRAVQDFSEDEVDRAMEPMDTVRAIMQQISIGKEMVIAGMAAQKAAKSGDVPPGPLAPNAVRPEMTVKDVAETLNDIKQLAQEVKAVAFQVQAFSKEKNTPEKNTPTVKAVEKPTVDAKLKRRDVQPSAETPTTSQTEGAGKTKAELRAERRAKQEAQRAAKESTTQVKAAAVKPKELNAPPGPEVSSTVVVKEKSPKPKTPKQTAKPQGHKVSWFRHLYNDDDKAKLNKIPINSNLHPAIIKLGVQLATRVVTGSNARCIALLDALKKMVQDYSLPAKTEFGRGLDAHLASSLEFLWSMRQPTASQTNAVKFFRHHLTQLPNNVDEFDAKKTLQEEIDRYIREQIDMAGEAISIAVRNKICKGDSILTYGCSSLIERIFVDAHLAGVEFRAVVCGGGVSAPAAREMTRRLTARGVPCICVDITALSFIMRTMSKVVVGCSALLANGSVLGAAGTAAVALAARAHNKPVLVACETHKFTERVQTDAFVYNEIGDPDELIDKSDENSPLKDWRSNPNLTPLNLTYDVTPPNLVTAVVTELAILPCTSAPVVLRFKLSEYSV